MKKLIKLITVKEAIKEHNRRGGGWQGDIHLSQRILISCLVELKTIVALLSIRQKKKPKKPSKYNLFFAKHAKKGKSAQEIAKLWKAERIK